LRQLGGGTNARDWRESLSEYAFSIGEEVLLRQALASLAASEDNLRQRSPDAACQP